MNLDDQFENLPLPDDEAALIAYFTKRQLALIHQLDLRKDIDEPWKKLKAQVQEQGLSWYRMVKGITYVHEIKLVGIHNREQTQKKNEATRHLQTLANKHDYDYVFLERDAMNRARVFCQQDDGPVRLMRKTDRGFDELKQALLEIEKIL